MFHDLGYHIDSDLDFRKGGRRSSRNRSRAEDLENGGYPRRSKSRQSSDGNHLIHPQSNFPLTSDTSDQENHNFGQQYLNLNGRLGKLL